MHHASSHQVSNVAKVVRATLNKSQHARCALAEEARHTLERQVLTGAADASLGALIEAFINTGDAVDDAGSTTGVDKARSLAEVLQAYALQRLSLTADHGYLLSEAGWQKLKALAAPCHDGLVTHPTGRVAALSSSLSAGPTRIWRFY